MQKHQSKKEGGEGREVVVEPTRRSIYDVLQTNLKIAKRNTFIHRLLYLGEHHFPKLESLEPAMERNYKLTNTGYCTEPLSGILLYYENYFCCIVEGSEEALHKHITLLFEHEEENFDNIKILSAIHHIKARFWNEWISYYGRPPQRVEEIDADSDLENSMRYLTDCCEKLYRFANEIISDHLPSRAITGSLIEDPADRRASYTKDRNRSLVEKDLYSANLPEKKLLRFLINCRFLKTLKQYHRFYEYIGQSRDFRFKAWPTPKNFVPYHIFDETYDPISDLPGDEEEHGKSDDEGELISAISNITTETS